MGIVTEHNPVIPAKYTDMADVSSIAGHNGLGGLATGIVNVIDCARMDISLQFNAMIPKVLRVLSGFLEVPPFNSWMQPSAAFIHRE
jgi:hypothetical protein